MPVLQSFDTTLIDVDVVHVSELPIHVIVSPLGVTISPQGYSDRAGVTICLHQGRLKLVLMAKPDQHELVRTFYLDELTDRCVSDED
jgi:hypothetical protein